MYLSETVSIAHLKVDEAPLQVSSPYANFANLFSSNLVAELPKHTKMNNLAIEFVDNEQLIHGSVYSLSSVELDILKIYIENNLASNFMTAFHVSS